MNDYELYVVEDKYFLKNLSLTFTLNAEVYIKICTGTGWKFIENVSVVPETELQLTTEEDGHYKVDLTLDAQTTTTYFKNYFDSIKKMVEDIERVFCQYSEGCTNCLKNTNICDMLLTAQSQVELIKRLFSPEIDPIVAEINSISNCYHKELLDCQTDSNFLNGKYTSPEELISNLIALDYIGLFLYFKTYEANSDIPSLEYIKTIFKSEDILCCIEKNYKIIFSEIESKIQSLNLIL